MNDLTARPLPRLLPRELESHKGDFGRAIIIGGSRGMAGAPAMAGMACLRSGAGLVTLGVPEATQPTVAAMCPAYTTMHLVEDDYGRIHWANATDLAAAAGDYDVWAVGPGLGSPEAAAPMMGRIYEEWFAPLVVDADGLNGVAVFEETRHAVLPRPAGPRVLTPHPGEYASLVRDAGLAEMAVGGEEQRIEAAAHLAGRDPSGQTVVVLKGRHTVVTDGSQFTINSTGNPGMATGGSGDVLTGVIIALLCQGLGAFDAARLGVHVHGVAGDLAAASLGQVSLIATDLIDHLPAAFQQAASEA